MRSHVRLHLLFGFLICGYVIIYVICRHGSAGSTARDIRRRSIVSAMAGEENRVLGLVS